MMLLAFQIPLSIGKAMLTLDQCSLIKQHSSKHQK